MRRPLVALLLMLACTSIVRAQSHSGLAPADEYFGRMKMSVLGIRNGLRDTSLRVAYDPRHAVAQLAACHWLEDAIVDWGNKYPHDTWLPGMISQLEHIYARIGSTQSHERVAHLLAWETRRGQERRR